MDKGGKSATFADLSHPNLASEVGLVGRLEYGRVRVDAAALLRTARSGVEKARKDCFVQFLTTPITDPPREGGVSSLTLPKQELAKASCDKRSLSAFMARDVTLITTHPSNRSGGRVRIPRSSSAARDDTATLSDRSFR